jgi:hypothetical protein
VRTSNSKQRGGCTTFTLKGACTILAYPLRIDIREQVRRSYKRLEGDSDEKD